MNDEQKAQLEETQGGTPTGDYTITVSQLEEMNANEIHMLQEIIERGETTGFIEEIRHHSIMIEMMARALVNKTKE